MKKIISIMSEPKIRTSFLLTGILTTIISLSVPLEQSSQQIMSWSGIILIGFFIGFSPAMDNKYNQIANGLIRFTISIIIIYFWLEFLSRKGFIGYMDIILVIGLIFVCYNMISLLIWLFKFFLFLIKKMSSKFLTQNKSAFIVGSENLIAFILSICTLATALVNVIHIFKA